MSEEIVLVEFYKRRPFSALVLTDQGDIVDYDIDYSRLDGEFYYDWAGGCSEPAKRTFYDGETYWLNPRHEDKVVVTGGRRIKSSKYAVLPEEYGWEDDVIWCEICMDVRSMGDIGQPCDHITWCNECGDYKTQNEDNYCDHDLSEQW
jgi:hypothetical protein